MLYFEAAGQLSSAFRLRDRISTLEDAVEAFLKGSRDAERRARVIPRSQELTAMLEVDLEVCFGPGCSRDLLDRSDRE